MHNIWLIFREDASNLFRNVMSVIVTIGLVLLPSLFCWYNMLACWNVFDNTGNLSIAVANLDEGYTSDYLPVEVNIGSEVESKLRANNQINWVITDSDDAIEGTKSGKYYAALVLPEDFSRQMLTFYENDAGSVKISYYVNEKVNAISPNITNAGADAVSKEVNSVFAETVSEVTVGLAKDLATYAEEGDASGTISDLTESMRGVSSRLDQTANVMELYSSLSKDSRSLLSSSTELIENARSQGQNVISSASGAKQSIPALIETLEASLNSLTSSIDSCKASLAQLESDVDTLLDGAASDVSAAATPVRELANKMDAQIANLTEIKAALESLRDELKSGYEKDLSDMIEAGKTEAEINAYVKVTVQHTVVLDEAIAVLSKMIDTLGQARDDLNAAADELEAGGADAKEKIAALHETIDRVDANITAAVDDFNNNVKPGIDQLKVDLQTLVDDLDSAASGLSSLSTDLPGVSSEVGSTLDDISGKIDTACTKLRLTAKELRDLADSIDEALASGDMETLRSLLSGSAEDVAKALSAPVDVEREALFPVNNFGSAMAPLYCALGLFIGSLLIMVATKPELSRRRIEELDNPKPRHLYFGRFGVVALLSFMQTTLLGLGNMLLLKVQVTEPLLYMICFWVSGLVFAFMIYTLVVAFGNLGKALAVLLLIVQVTGCGGSYPLPIMPDFVQAISPFLPATHVVNALRAAMFGLYQNDFWISMGTLLLFVLPFLLLGLVLRKPLDRFMHFYVSKVEESKLVE